ncbi:helix-turn-helix transcriptional regulator [Micromonospora sp. NPDC047074]|uniref:helix-turn-helix transcriptional regulator n=1 Tax=Micromonospora sp. NPDC047074 TaxID=3154339 RepID=UPI0033D22AF2
MGYEDEQRLQMVGTLAEMAVHGPAALTAGAAPGAGRGETVPAPLSGDAVTRLVVDALGAPVEPAVRALVAAAGGHPLLLAELLEGVRAEGVVRGTGRARTPKRVQNLVRARLCAAPTGSWQLIRVAAVLGRACRLAELAAMTGRNTAQMLPELDALLDAGLLHWVGDDLAFRHELVWWAVLDALPPAVWQALRADRDRLCRRPAASGAGEPAAEPADQAPVDRASVDRVHGDRVSADRVHADLRRRIALRAAPGVGDRRGDGGGAWESFSGVERAIARLVAEGMTNRQIATRVRLSPHTVNYHLRGLFRRLGISSRAELVRHVPVSSAA